MEQRWRWFHIKEMVYQAAVNWLNDSVQLSGSVILPNQIPDEGDHIFKKSSNLLLPL